MVVKRVLRRGAAVAARFADRGARALGAAAAYLRLGPRGYRDHQRAVRDVNASAAVAAHRGGSTFANGLTTSFTSERARRWHHLYWKPIVIVLYGQANQDVSAWLRAAAGVLHARFLIGASIADDLRDVAEVDFAVSGEENAPDADLGRILDWMHRTARRWDLVLLDVANPLPDPHRLIELQHAAHEYHNDREIGIVTPAYRSASKQVAAGYEVDRATGEVVPSAVGVRDHGQADLPRYVLTAAAHGLYITAAAIDAIDIAERHLVGLDLHGQAGRLVRHAWAGNIRTLCLPTTVMEVGELPALRLAGEQLRWFSERSVTAPGGARRIVFVLNATSISGGIRVVFEMANGLAGRGFDVEVWSLEGPPVWFDLRVPVRTYRNYDDLLLSLRNVDAIKVATWWETAQVVWLASANHGLPVYLIQEFETWFYPDDPIARAAVVSSYRREFVSITQASYQRDELAGIGVSATLIPLGYDDAKFRVLADVERASDHVLALGRSFFQKNFAMTARAWQSLGGDRPRLLLFGAEPDILQDERAEYHIRPSDAEVNRLYNRATLFVQTSLHEGFSLPLLEAMAAGCPVVTTDSHGNRDFCADDENCVIVPQNDPTALATAMRDLLADPAHRERLRAGGLSTAQRYTWSISLDRVASFYEQLATDALPVE